MPNRLAKEKSPYLLQHADNPVDWYPWGEEALRKARNDGKPIFLSIGYSTCHWCHVLEAESFEDEETAAFLNKNFIAIKVDREERPEIDAYYMKAVQMMTGGGGWPLSVFLSPDLKPYYGGTYFPPKPRQGMPSFMQVLEFASRVWKENRGQVGETGAEITKAIMGDASEPASEIVTSVVAEGATEIVSSFDERHGGFGTAPKFPLPVTLMFLLRYHYKSGNELALRCVTKTLDGMIAGGIRDHVGGGFHRYSTDRVWLVPHFEKMLYDNALLSKLLVEAFQVTGREEYAAVAAETLDWALAEMRADNGGFYSAQDADTVEGEGTYYSWTPGEVEAALGPGEAEMFMAIYGVTQNGNLEGGRSILHLGEPTSPRTMGSGWRAKLCAARRARPRPQTDTKEMTSWNGLCISALATAGAALDRRDYVDAARAASRFFLDRVSTGGRLLRRFAGGEAGLDGTLEDYAFFVQGLLDLFEATGEPVWLGEATRLVGAMVDEFEDSVRGGMFLTVGAEPARLVEVYDGPTPSGNSVAVMDLLRIDALSGGGSQRDTAERAVKRFMTEVQQSPSSHANLLAGIDLLSGGCKEVVITGKTSSAVEKMRSAVSTTYHPDAVVLAATSETYEELLPMTGLLRDRPLQAKARAYVCRNFSCKLPSSTPEELLARLGER